MDTLSAASASTAAAPSSSSSSSSAAAAAQRPMSPPFGGSDEEFDVGKPVPLQNSWSFWHDRLVGPNAGIEEYEAALQKLCTFNTVQSFWHCYNNLPATDKLRSKSSYHMMREGIRPIWEDPENANGGFWTIRIKPEDTAACWRELLLAVIGEQFTNSLRKDDEINGCTVSVRQYDNVLQLWNKDASETPHSLFAALRAILPPQTEIKNSFYKECRGHAAFGKQSEDKK